MNSLKMFAIIAIFAITHICVTNTDQHFKKKIIGVLKTCNKYIGQAPILLRLLPGEILDPPFNSVEFSLFFRYKLQSLKALV